MKIILNPPFQKYEFGIDKSLSFTQGEHDLSVANIDFSTINDDTYKQLIVNTFQSSNPLVIGEIDGYVDIFIHPETLKIYALSAYVKEQLECIADNPEALYKIASAIKSIWELYGIERPSKYLKMRFLKKTPESVALYKQAIEDFKNYSPTANPLYWIELAFGGLTIGLEL
jgi:hypothetical protein